MFALLTPATASPGAPIFLDAHLVRAFDPSTYHPDEVVGYDPVYAPGPPHEGPLPPDLTLVSRDRNLTFDYHPARGGFIVSSSFLGVAESVGAEGFAHVPVAVVTPTGDATTDKTYAYLQFEAPHACIDYEASEYRVGSRMGPFREPTAEQRRELAEGSGPTQVRTWKAVVLKPECSGHRLFGIARSIFARFAFCDGRFEAAATDAGLSGFDTVAVHELASVYARRTGR